MLRPFVVLAAFPEVRRASVAPVFVLSFIFDDLQSLEHIEAKAHYAALLASVLDVDGLVVMVDENLRHNPAVVVEALSPLWNILFAFWACSLIRTTSFPCDIAFYPEEAQCNAGDLGGCGLFVFSNGIPIGIKSARASVVRP